MTPDPALPAAADVVRRHDDLLGQAGWPPAEAADRDPGAGTPTLWTWLEANHRFNALLWAQEDLARRRQAPDAEIVGNKRAIDRCNQARNDAIERMDEVLMAALGLVVPGAQGDEPALRPRAAGARLNSETAGSIIDRLSILALKRRAMQAQCERDDVDEAHRALSRARLARLNEQRGDLAACLDALLADTLAGRAWFKVYRQFKMYNDVRLNPVLAAEAKAAGGGAGG